MYYSKSGKMFIVFSMNKVECICIWLDFYHLYLECYLLNVKPVFIKNGTSLEEKKAKVELKENLFKKTLTVKC